MTFQILGAGMAGLLAGNMLRSSQPFILEKQNQIPNNHKAILRFRTAEVSHATGIHFRMVEVFKDIHMQDFNSQVAVLLSYGHKIGSSNGLRSIMSAIGGKSESRFIAPDNFIQLMNDGLTRPVQFGENGLELIQKDFPTISTLPMPVLAEYLGYKFKSNFESKEGWVGHCDLPDGFDLYATLYFPQGTIPYYRASITGKKLIVESIVELKSADVLSASHNMGLDVSFYNIQIEKQKYAKINPIDESERKTFIMWATENFNIYSLGRFAVWKPGLLLDNVVNDVRVIQKMMSGNKSQSYNMRKSS